MSKMKLINEWVYAGHNRKGEADDMNDVITQVDLTNPKSSRLIAFIHAYKVTLLEEAFCPNKIELFFNEVAILSAIKTAHITKIFIREGLEAFFYDTGVLLVKQDHKRNTNASIPLHFDQIRKLQNEMEKLRKHVK